MINLSLRLKSVYDDVAIFVVNVRALNSFRSVLFDLNFCRLL